MREEALDYTAAVATLARDAPDPRSPSPAGRAAQSILSSGFMEHYRNSGRSVRDILREILGDLSTYKSVHRWDDKLFVSPVEELIAVVRRFLSSSDEQPLNFVLANSRVDEIIERDGSARSYPVMARAHDVGRQLFFLQVNSFHSLSGN